MAGDRRDDRRRSRSRSPAVRKRRRSRSRSREERRRRSASPDKRRRDDSRDRRRDRDDSRSRQRAGDSSRGGERGGQGRHDDGDRRGDGDRRRRDDPARHRDSPDPRERITSRQRSATAGEASGRPSQGDDGSPAGARPHGAGDAAGNGAAAENGGGAAAATAAAAPADGGAGGDAAAPSGTAAAVAKAPLASRTGGAYIPRFKLLQMMSAVTDKSSPEYQRMTWDALRKSLNGLINKVNTANLANILPELFGENLVRGRGLFCRALMKAQAASVPFTPVYAALVAVINTKLPEIGELLLHRLVSQFKRGVKRNDKPVTVAVSKFLAHLINQGVAHEVLALEILILLLENPSDDSVEMAIEFTKEVGAYLQEVAGSGLYSVFERFRAILHEGEIDKRVQYMIEGLFAIRKAGFEASGLPAVRPELDLVESEDQITHEIGLEDELSTQVALDVFKADPEYEEHEKEYQAIKADILGEEEGGDEGAEGDAEDGSEEEGDEEESEDADNENGGGQGAGGMDIQDQTSTNLVNLRRTIYLTIMSSLDFEEAGHKLMKINIQPGQENELVTMIIECASNERTYIRYYALLAARFAQLRREYQELFETCFQKQYALIHRLETNKLRNCARLFAHLLSVDAISWGVLSCMRLTEADTTSSSRIFIKYLFQELSETLGLVKLNNRLNDPNFQGWFAGLFPRDSLVNMRFSINFFTSIGLGGVTDKMRETYKEMSKPGAMRAAAAEAAAAVAAQQPASGSSDLSSSSSSSDDSSSSSGDSSTSSSSSDDSSSSSSSDSESEDSRDKRRRGSRRKR